jgi:hypothetical protein
MLKQMMYVLTIVLIRLRELRYVIFIKHANKVFSQLWNMCHSVFEFSTPELWSDLGHWKPVIGPHWISNKWSTVAVEYTPSALGTRLSHCQWRRRLRHHWKVNGSGGNLRHSYRGRFILNVVYTSYDVPSFVEESERPMWRGSLGFTATSRPAACTAQRQTHLASCADHLFFTRKQRVHLILLNLNLSVWR